MNINEKARQRLARDRGLPWRSVRVRALPDATPGAFRVLWQLPGRPWYFLRCQRTRRQALAEVAHGV